MVGGAEKADFFPSSTLIKASMLQSIKDVPTIKELHTWIFNLLCFNDAKTCTAADIAAGSA